MNMNKGGAVGIIRVLVTFGSGDFYGWGAFFQDQDRGGAFRRSGDFLLSVITPTLFESEIDYFWGSGDFSWSRALFRDYGFDDQRFFLDLRYFSIAFYHFQAHFQKIVIRSSRHKIKIFSPITFYCRPPPLLYNKLYNPSYKNIYICALFFKKLQS